MQIKSVGFSIKNRNNNINIYDVFQYLIKASKKEIKTADFIRKVLISEDNEYYVGLVLTFKNQKRNCKSKIKDGNFHVVVEDLIGDEKIISFNFFCLRRSNLKGLYLYYHNSCAVGSFFGYMRKTSNQYIDSIHKKEFDELGDNPDPKKIKLLNNKYKNRLEFSVLANKGDIGKILSNLKEIKKPSLDLTPYVLNSLK